MFLLITAIVVAVFFIATAYLLATKILHNYAKVKFTQDEIYTYIFVTFICSAVETLNVLIFIAIPLIKF